jgi:hypothetical protein
MRDNEQMRDDFVEQIRRALALRVGHQCSRPECSASTTGPQDDQEKSINLGVAAHITAASVGGPRYDPALTSGDRSSAGNGIWLCQNCAKLIDNDESRFPVSLLRDGKRGQRKQRSHGWGALLLHPPRAR